MMKKKVIQRLPYYVPHKGGLETHAQQRAYRWNKKGYGTVFTFVGQTDQREYLQTLKKEQKIQYEGREIGYHDGNNQVIIMPSFEAISNFPVPKFRTTQYKLATKYLKKQETEMLITRTRFFLPSFTGGLFAKWNKIKRMHIEHGSDYVQVQSKVTNLVAKIYDHIVGRIVLSRADIVVPISLACQRFTSKFTKRKTQVIYRGIEVEQKNETDVAVDDFSQKFPGKTIVGYAGRLYKRKNVETLIKAVHELPLKERESIQCVIVGGGEDFERLQAMDPLGLIYFTGGASHGEFLALQKQFDIHVHSSSPGGGISSSLLQAMALGCQILATPYEGADEVLIDKKNGVVVPDDSLESIFAGLKESLKYVNTETSKEWAAFNKKLLAEKFSREENIQQYVSYAKETK